MPTIIATVTVNKSTPTQYTNRRLREPFLSGNPFVVMLFILFISIKSLLAPPFYILVKYPLFFSSPVPNLSQNVQDAFVRCAEKCRSLLLLQSLSNHKEIIFQVEAPF